jgi:hypothetical protein
MKKMGYLYLQHVQYCARHGPTPTARETVEKSGPRLEFNFLGRLAIILAFVFIQFLVGLLV